MCSPRTLLWMRKLGEALSCRSLSAKEPSIFEVDLMCSPSFLPPSDLCSVIVIMGCLRLVACLKLQVFLQNTVSFIGLFCKRAINFWGRSNVLAQRDLRVQLPHSYCLFWLSPISMYLYMFIYTYTFVICVCSFLIQSDLYILYFDYLPFDLLPYLYTYVCSYVYIHIGFVYAASSFRAICIMSILMISHVYILIYIYIYTYIFDLCIHSSFKVICIMSVLMISHVYILIYIYIYTYIFHLCIQLPDSKRFAYCLFWWWPMLFPRSPPVHIHDPILLQTWSEWVAGRVGEWVWVCVWVCACVRLCACVGGGWM